jgi:hypothetical protein
VNTIGIDNNKILDNIASSFTRFSAVVEMYLDTKRFRGKVLKIFSVPPLIIPSIFSQAKAEGHIPVVDAMVSGYAPV